MSQWFAMVCPIIAMNAWVLTRPNVSYQQPKLFAKSVTVASRVLSSTSDPNRIVYSQTQEYTFRLFKFKKVRSGYLPLGL